MKILKSHVLFTFIAICALFSGTAQTSTFSPKGSLSINLGVPAKPHNKAFERTMEGLLNGGVDFRYNLYKGFTMGIGLKYSFFTLNSFAFNNNTLTGGYQMPGAYVMMGYEKFTTDRVSFTASIRGGYSYMMSFNDSCRAILGGQAIDQSIFIEPQIEMVMLTDKTASHAFSMFVGYAIYFHEFGRADLCMDEVSTLAPEDYEGYMRFFSIGLGYRNYFGRN